LQASTFIKPGFAIRRQQMRQDIVNFILRVKFQMILYGRGEMS
jgi:hypothetical protein